MPEDNAIPVRSPALYQQTLGKRKRLQLPDIANMPLLHLSTRLEDWRNWFELHEHANDVSAVKGARYELFTMLLEACIAGLGIALIPRYMAQKEIAAGTLIIPIERSLPQHTSYFLVYPESQINYPPLQAFRTWLLEKTRSWAPQVRPMENLVWIKSVRTNEWCRKKYQLFRVKHHSRR